MHQEHIICIMGHLRKSRTPAAAIVNTTSGSRGTDESRDEIRRLIQGVSPGAEVIFTESGLRTVDEAHRALERGASLVIAGGGDGTISAVASVLAGTGNVLGVLPLGTRNHFARDLGVPDNLLEAAHVLAAGTEKRVDMGEVNGRVFINNSGLGLYPAIVLLREERQEQGTPKRRAMIAAGLRALARYRLLSVHVTAGGKRLSRRTPIVFVGNNEYTMEGLSAGSRSRLDSGELSLVIPHHATRLGLMWFVLKALMGSERPDPNLDVLSARELVIRAGHRIVQATVDGEVVTLTTPLSYRIRAGDLRVLAPAPGR